ncbi:MAG: TAXI family TRAP transporter solute-binding subunit [Spirochaetes bacterium]|uniref:TAXI family TRAP transporter solute-binding subunit n=1 Tax=Candidatus Ornithospirochaeta stercoripullorum TaxID=2840899 RepID=A0A9D9H5F3_9SPIO|nr:TAXI family TRAP transporter solute-binding subunit [Candidatus Ornithospirochaeta stercoripullorum]
MKKTFALVAILIIALAIPVFAGGAAEGGNLRFGTGGDQGTYYGFGNVLAQRISSETDTGVVAVVSAGSQDNIEMMDMGQYQLGFVQTDVMSYAYNGTNLFAETGAVTDFSTVAALYLEQVQIVTLDPNIKTVGDLEGKTVSIGSSGSGVYYNALDILAAYGLTEDDISPTYQSFGDSVDALQDGKIDAAFVVAGAPTVAVSTLATTHDVRLVSIDDEHMDILLSASPYYTPVTIGASVYGTDEDCQTVAVGAVIIARDDVSEDAVYDIVSTIFNDKEAIAQSHDKGNELDLGFATSITTVPYHPGAAKYFAEQGIEVPVK